MALGSASDIATQNASTEEFTTPLLTVSAGHDMGTLAMISPTGPAGLVTLTANAGHDLTLHAEGPVTLSGLSSAGNNFELDSALVASGDLTIASGASINAAQVTLAVGDASAS